MKYTENLLEKRLAVVANHFSIPLLRKKGHYSQPQIATGVMEGLWLLNEASR